MVFAGGNFSMPLWMGLLMTNAEFVRADAEGGIIPRSGNCRQSCQGRRVVRKGEMLTFDTRALNEYSKQYSLVECNT
jgi:hypothetical protein